MSDVQNHPLRSLERVALVAIGGFAGSNLRYFVDLLVGGLGATLVVNAAGSFALGLLVYGVADSEALAPETRSVLATGFLSSLTTYSTFALETVQSTPLWFLANVVASYALGFAGVLAARVVVTALHRRGN
ncbi:MAG: CrcB family protein [Haloarculaceae archaeon]